MSFGDIGSIIRRHYEEEKAETRKEEGSAVALSRDTQVFKHFEQALAKEPDLKFLIRSLMYPMYDPRTRVLRRTSSRASKRRC
jgi:hypothetical protein